MAEVQTVKALDIPQTYANLYHSLVGFTVDQVDIVLATRFSSVNPPWLKPRWIEHRVGDMAHWGHGLLMIGPDGTMQPGPACWDSSG